MKPLRFPQHRSLFSLATIVPASLIIFCILLSSVRSQTFSKTDRELSHEILNEIKGDLKKEYYDPDFHGLDLDARFKLASGMLDKATSVGQAMGIIAQTVMGLNDSHTCFLPPLLTAHVDYGWEMQMIGEDAYVVTVDPGRDAERVGLKPGDRVRSIDGIVPTRDNLWKIEYLYNALRPQLGMRIMAQSPGEAARQIDARSQVWEDTKARQFWGTFHRINPDYIKEVEHQRELHKDRVLEIDANLVVWKLTNFNLVGERVDDALKKIRKHKALILDLRGNPGGHVMTLKLVLGSLFDKDIKLADRRTRKELSPEVVKSRGGSVFKGDLVVLVDSESASAAEILARAVQLEKRGTVIGDRTSGAVMESRRYPHHTGSNMPGTISRVDYGLSVTVADLIMSDGKSLEHTGVFPDEIILPTSMDLLARRDIVLSRAAKLLGASLDPEKAGALLSAETKQ